MKKLIVLLFAVLLLTGCTGNEETVVAALPEPTAPPVLPVTEVAVNDDTATFDFISVSLPAAYETYFNEDGSALFSSSSQHIQLVYPDAELADKIILDFLNRVDKVMPDVQNTFAYAQQQYDPDLPWYPYFYHLLYNPTRIDNDVLSLVGTQSSFIGGVHSNVFAVSANYDMMTGDVLTLGSIMHENAQKEEFIDLILDKLKQNKEELYLFEDYEDAVYSRFQVDENLYEDFFFTTTGLDFYFSPYEIAPYASGIITVEIPYAELPGLIYDGYFPAEKEQIRGSMHCESMELLEMEQFENMAEVVLSDTAAPLVIYPEGTVEDIQITIDGDGMNIQTYTVFASPQMKDTDAIILYASSDILQSICVQYFSGSAKEELKIG